MSFAAFPARTFSSGTLTRYTVCAARNIIQRNPGVEKVLILERPPRFDPPTVDPSRLKNYLSNYGNKALHDALADCDVKNKITICAHSLPETFQSNLYGHPNRYDFDGIHLNGIDGRNHFTRSLCNILQKHLNKHARELHNHKIPRFVEPSSSSSLPTSSTPAPTLHTSKEKPDTVVIDIEPSILADNLHYTYSIPTYNPFTILGN